MMSCGGPFDGANLIRRATGSLIGLDAQCRSVLPFKYGTYFLICEAALALLSCLFTGADTLRSTPR